MGVNYGKRRGRMEILGGISSAIAYSIGTRNQKFDHVNEDSYLKEINDRLDVVEKKFRQRK